MITALSLGLHPRELGQLSTIILQNNGIGECGSTLNVGLSGIVQKLIQKSTGKDRTFLSIFFLNN